MITLRPGSHVHRLLHLLATAGEIPSGALPLLGNGRVLSALVHRLTSVQDIRFDKGGQVFRARLIQTSGRKGRRTIRLYRKGLPVLDGLWPGLLDWYLDAHKGHSFSNDRFHIERNHRVAEAVALCMAAGVEARPYALPALQKAAIIKTVPDAPAFYIARDLKRAGGDGTSKTAYTRLVGALFCPGGAYAAYNTRAAVMKWSGLGEAKAQGGLLELARMNAGRTDIPSALLFGAGPDTALATILESDKSRRHELRFDRIYPHVHFVPLDQNGARLLGILVSPDWNERLLNALFEPHQRSYDRGAMEYDAIDGSTLILSQLDGNIARLIRFRDALDVFAGQASVLCYPWQTPFLKSYLGSRAGIRELDMSAVEASLGLN